MAVASLSTALQGRLPSNQTARALYYRGLAYRKQGMPGQATSDLTSALQQKDGLSDAERTDAEFNRVAASREAGLPETETAVVTLSPRENAPSTSAAAVPTPAPSMDKSIVTGSLAPAQEPRRTSSDWSGSTNVAVVAAVSAARQPAPAPSMDKSIVTGSLAPAQEPRRTGSDWSGSTNVAVVAVSAARQPPPAPTMDKSIVTGSLAPAQEPRRTGSDWSGSTNVAVVAVSAARPPPIDKSIVTGSLAPAQEPRRTGSNWSGESSVVVAALGPVAETSTALVTQVAAVAPEKMSETPRDVHLQIASVRSRSEAFALSVRLTSQYGGEFGRRRLRVSETLVENQGPTYRLRLGPYASAEEPQRLCVSLRAGGYDCVVE